MKSAPGSEALWTTWSVGGAAPGHMRADKLRRSNRSQALCESTSSYGGRHRLPCGRAQTMCPCYDSKTQLSEPPVHPLLLASPGQAPAASLGHWLPAPYIYIYCLTVFVKPYKSLNCQSSSFLQEDRPVEGRPSWGLWARLFGSLPLYLAVQALQGLSLSFSQPFSPTSE